MCRFEPVLRVAECQAKALRAARAGWILSPGFDASLSDILTTLMSGATLYIPEFSPTQTKRLAKFVDLHQIDTLDVPPSLLDLLDRERFPSLRSVVCGGEPVTDSIISKWSDALHIVYGPTEAAVCSNMLSPIIPMGGPWIGDFVDGCDGKILVGNDLKDRGIGELWLSGENLAVGYLGDPEQTNLRFVRRGDIPYFRTGDIVDTTNAIPRFIGRVDRQTKIRGCLVCPEEIELALSRVLGPVAVVPDGGKLVLHCESPMTLREVNQLLADSFPSHMMISAVRRHDRLPSKPNGKMDFSALTT